MMRIASVGVAAILIAACTNDPGERALTGAGIGAAVGATGAALTDQSVIGGALIGGAVGAAAGGLTTQDQINLGGGSSGKP